jgi:hypothetical protein
MKDYQLKEVSCFEKFERAYKDRRQHSKMAKMKEAH